MIENISKDFLIILFILTTFLFLISLFFIFYLLKKKRGDSDATLKSLPSNTILINVSEEFKKEIEDLIKIQIEKSYRELISSIFPEIKSSILINAEKFGKQLKLLTEGAEKDLSKSREMMQTIFQELINENKKNIERIGQSFLLESKEKINSLSLKLEKEISKTLEQANLETMKKIKEMEGEIEEIKKEKIKEVEKNVYQILNDVAKKILGKAIDLSTHEELVFKALEKAKKEKFF
jgi:F0F1-type ATP synthase membrane subunit b/b'